MSVGQDAVFVEQDEERQKNDDQQIADDAQAEQRDAGERLDEVAAQAAEVGQDVLGRLADVDLEAQRGDEPLNRRQDLRQARLERWQLGNEAR